MRDSGKYNTSSFITLSHTHTLTQHLLFFSHPYLLTSKLSLVLYTNPALFFGISILWNIHIFFGIGSIMKRNIRYKIRSCVERIQVRVQGQSNFEFIIIVVLGNEDSLSENSESLFITSRVEMLTIKLQSFH